MKTKVDMGLLRALPILFFAAALPLFRQLLFGAAPLDDDVFTQDLPALEWLARSLHSGDSLLWAPQLLGGFPLAFTQYPFFYPPDLLLAYLLSPAQAYAWSQLLHLLLAGILTFLYCRSAGLHLGPSLLSALSFQMSSEMVAGISGHAAHGMFALPGTMLATELVLRAGWRAVPLLALVIAAELLVSHPQVAMLTLIPGGIYALFRLIQEVRTRGAGESSRTTGWLALGALIGLAMASVRMLPLWSMVDVSTRATGLPAGATLAGALTLQGMVVGYFLPLTHLQTLPWGAPDYLGPAALVLAVLGLRRLALRPLGVFFVGLAAIMLLLALGDATPLFYLTRLPLVSFFRDPSRFSVIASFALAIMAGMTLDLCSTRSLSGNHEDTKTRRPRSMGPTSCLRAFMGGLGSGSEAGMVGLGEWRLLAVATVVTALWVAVFFGLGLIFQFGSGPAVDGFKTWCESHLVDSLNPLRPRMGIPALGLPLVLLALTLAAAGRLSRSQLEVFLISLTFLVLLPVGVALNPSISPAVWARVPPVAATLQAETVRYRVFSQVPGLHLYNYMKEYGPSPEAAYANDLRYRYQAELLAPVLNLRWDVNSVDGYENFHSIHQEVMLRYILSQYTSGWINDDRRWAQLTWSERLRVLSMLNVRYVLSALDLSAEAPELKRVAQWQLDPGPLGRATPSMFLMENPAALPRYYLVQRARSVSGGSALEQDEEALYLIAKGEVDPATTVLLPEEGAVPAWSAEIASTSDAASWTRFVDVVSARNAEVDLTVSTDRPAYLVTSDSYWPGWRAFVDGKEAPILRANATGRALWLGDAGIHRVIFRFEPVSFSAGLVLSIVATLVTAFWLGVVVFAKRRL